MRIPDTLWINLCVPVFEALVYCRIPQANAERKMKKSLQADARGKRRKRPQAYAQGQVPNFVSKTFAGERLRVSQRPISVSLEP